MSLPDALGALLENNPRSARSLWDCLATDPTTGVTVIGADDRVLYLNERSRRDFGAAGVTDDLTGRRMDEVGLDADYVAERREHVAAVVRTGRPRLVRSIWMGWQVALWFAPLGGVPNDAGGVDGAAAVLCVGRRLPGIHTARTIAGPGYEVIYADRIQLGPLDALTERELEVTALVGAGLTIKEVARELHRSPKTVEKHRLSAGQKLGLSDRAQLIEIVHRAGLEPADAQRSRIRL